MDWRLLAAACLPLAVFTYEGKAYADDVSFSTAPAGSVLASTLFALLPTTAAFAFTLRHPHWFLGVVAAQSLLLAAAGERSPVAMSAVALVLMLARAGSPAPRRQVHAPAALVIAAALVIGAARAESGRAFQYAGLPTRTQALASGVTGLAASSADPGLAAQLASRLDGDAFTAGILQARAMGMPLLAVSGVADSVLVAVPSALWPSKLSHGTSVAPADAETDAFGLQQVKFLPTLPELYAGFLSWPWLLALIAVAGLAAVRGER